MECADKPYGRRRRRRRQLRVRTARALLVLALRCINHHCIRCLHGLRPRLEDLRQGAQPQLGLARGCGLGALQFWQRRANRVSAVAHRTAHPAEPGGGWGLRASRLLRSLRGFEHAVANGAASAAAPSEAHPKEEREDASDEGCRSVAGIRAASDDDQLAASSALALPVAAARHACLRAAPAVAHRTRGSRATAAGRRQHSARRQSGLRIVSASPVSKLSPWPNTRRASVCAPLVLSPLSLPGEKLPADLSNSRETLSLLLPSFLTYLASLAGFSLITDLGCHVLCRHRETW